MTKGLLCIVRNFMWDKQLIHHRIEFVASSNALVFVSMTGKDFWLIFNDVVLQCCPKSCRSFTFTYIVDALFRKKTNMARKTKRKKEHAIVFELPRTLIIHQVAEDKTYVIAMVVYVFYRMFSNGEVTNQP
jgi:hypothetical protein